MRLADKVALITGGGSGIGRATAVLFAAEGAKVVVADVNLSDALETAQTIASQGGVATAFEVDVSSSPDVERMVESAAREYDGLHVLVNSAAVNARNAVPDGGSIEEVYDRVLEVNLKGVYLVTYYAIKVMERAGVGSIINLASTMSMVGYHAGLGGGFNPYPLSKGGVLQFTRNLAVDYARRNIRVNCIVPGYVTTNLTSSITESPEMLKRVEELHPIGRFARPEEIAYAALFLASDESSYVIGSPLIVDGGYTAQ
jgi:NAD(P)-dependent dehydrogenase (short-subunit alcohol dehydrogenase family)